MTSASQRARWRLVRRGRYRRALAALRDGRAHDALRALAHPGAAGDERAEALSAIAMVVTAPALPAAAQCVAVLERTGVDPETSAAAVDVLAPVLWQGPGHPPRFVAHVAQLTDRLMRVTGPLRWGNYNLAVHALQAGDCRGAAAHLAAGAAAPVGGWPLPILGAACAAIFGEPAALVRSLAGPIVDTDLADDYRFFTGVREVFACLWEDRQFDPVRLGAMFAGPPGPLTRTVPTLFALRTLLTDVVRGAPSFMNPALLRESVWGQWLWDRLRYAAGEATNLLSLPDSDQPALTWQRLGARQDLLALLPEATAQALWQRFLDFGESATAFWARLVDLRARLGEVTAAPAEEVPDQRPGVCPWWPADGILQALAGQEAEVECGYLEGRRALRGGHHDDALRWFADTRARLTGAGMATRLMALRFGPLLAYWEGVALAHLGRHDEAAGPLRACVDSVKAREARAQLGLLAVATGNHAQATDLLATITDPRPAAADYLAALLAVRDDKAGETAHLLSGLAGKELVAGPYLMAGHRLRGRVHEAAGDLAEAAQEYRQALTHRRTDPVAAARLARVWLRQRYDGADVPAEPLLEQGWPMVTGVAWAEWLPVVRTCLDDLTISRARVLLSWVPAEVNLRLLALHSVTLAGAADAAASAVREWVDATAEPDPRLVRAARVARAAEQLREFCREGGKGPVRDTLTELADELAEDPSLAFWAETTRVLLNHESVATAPPISVDGPAPARLFAGLLGVFAADPEQRRSAALVCQAELAAVEDKSARAMVKCLAADVLGDTGEFLAAYGEIETAEDVLPCDPAAGYLAATEARLRVGDLDAVTEGFIPTQLADLADARVRRAIGVAYARRAVRTSDRDPRAALRDLDQARELLGEPL